MGGQGGEEKKGSETIEGHTVSAVTLRGVSYRSLPSKCLWTGRGGEEKKGREN